MAEYKEEKLTIALKLLRALVRQAYNYTICADGKEHVPCFDQLHAQVVEIIQASADLAQSRAITEEHLLKTIVQSSRTIAELFTHTIAKLSNRSINMINQEMKELGFSLSPSSSSPQEERKRLRRDTRPAPSPTRSTKTQEEPPPIHSLFTEKGSLRLEKITSGLREILEQARGYQACMGQIRSRYPG